MVHDPLDPQTWGAGSFFKNPECSEVALDEICRRLRVPAAAVPHWLVGGRVRLSAGWLVERAGFGRGHRAGHVALRDRHALGIVNVPGRASAEDLVSFARRLRRLVHSDLGIPPEAAPVILRLP